MDEDQNQCDAESLSQLFTMFERSFEHQEGREEVEDLRIEKTDIDPFWGQSGGQSDPWADIDGVNGNQETKACFEQESAPKLKKPGTVWETSFEGDLYVGTESPELNMQWKPAWVILSNFEGNFALKVFQSARDPVPYLTLHLNIEHSLSEMKEKYFSEFSKAFSVKIMRRTFTLQPKLNINKLFNKKFIFSTKNNIRVFLEKDKNEKILKLGSLDLATVSRFVQVFEFLRLKFPADESFLPPTEAETAEITVHNNLTMWGSPRLVSRLFSEINLKSLSPVEIGLNLKQRKGREVVKRGDIMPNVGDMEDSWVSVENPILHYSTESEEFKENGILSIKRPLLGYRVELLRIDNVTVPASFYPPINVGAHMHVEVGKMEIEVILDLACPWQYKSKGQIMKFLNCRNVVVHVPFPDEWCYHFSRVKLHKRRGAARVHSAPNQLTSSANAVKVLMNSLFKSPISVTAGLAKYEDLHRSLVWRVDSLPLKNGAQKETHMLKCCLELKDYDAYPESYRDFGHVSYEIESPLVFNLAVRTISVPGAPDLVKSLTYKTFIEDKFKIHNS